MTTTRFKAYESYMSDAKRSRSYAVYFAGCKNWERAFAHAETARTEQVKADEHFNFYLDALALNDAFNNAPDTVATFHDLVIQRRYRRRSGPRDSHS